ILSNNGGYGINFSGASTTDIVLQARAVRIAGNAFYNNSGKYNPSGLTISENEKTVDPTYTNTGGNNYSVGMNLKAKGYPVGGSGYVGTYSSTYNYEEPGAAQRQEAGGILLNPGLGGGIMT